MRKKVVSMVLCFALLVSLFSVPVFAANVISTASIESAIAYAYNIKDTDPSRFSGYCAAFVWRCYHDGAGLGNSSYATAREMGDALITNTDSNPPRGAFVFWYDSNGPTTKAGHVALSLGDGNVIHAYSDVKVTSIATVNSSHYIYRGWGAPIAGYTLATAAQTEPPKYCWVNIDKGAESTYNMSETVRLTYHAENVNYYTVEIYKDGAAYECFDTYYGEYNKTMTAVGRYNAVVSAVNDGGRTYSGWISWNVVNPSAVGPNVSYISISNRNVFPNEQFRINFWSETAKYYNVKIVKDGVTYKDENVYVGYYDTSLHSTGQYSIQIKAVNDYGSSVGYDGVYVIDSAPDMPTITTMHDCYGINEDIEILLTCGKYTQTSYMTIRKCTDTWETVFSDSVTDITKKTIRFPTAGYYTIEYQNSNIYGASPCASKGLYVYDSVPDMPSINLDQYVYSISENIDISLRQGVYARTSYMSVYSSSDELVFTKDVSGQDTQALAFDTAGEYTINYQSANTFGQSKIAVLTFSVGKAEIVVTFDPNGEALGTAQKTVSRDSPYGELPIPEYDGKIFLGWFTSEENGELIEADTIVTALDDHTLYAVWQTQPLPEDAPILTVSDSRTQPGKEIEVTVDLAGNTGFASLGIEIGYDAEVMTLTNVTAEPGVGAIFTKAQSLSANPFNMGWDSVSNITYNGNLATLTFTVDENAPDGVYPITVDFYKGVNGNYTDGVNVNYDEDFEAVGFVYVSGNVTVASYIPGDISGDEMVDNKDATFLLRYLAGWSQANIVEDALDVDGSGMVDNKDATVLLRYLAGWDVALH